ncbi:MAG: hypothetical protein KIS92_03340 [Planctomycetota bacterium]|nr:hypothetical protein [Planctomycetota bacterium]
MSDEHAPLSDRTVTMVIIGVALIAMVISFVLAMRAGIPGAPGAPLG